MQEEPNGCGIAALAMLLGLTYAEARAEVAARLSQHGGVSVFLLDQTLALHGYAVARRFSHNSTPWPPRPFAAAHLCLVRVTHAAPVDHWVVMLDSGDVLDPLLGYPVDLTYYARVDSVAAVVPLPGRD